MRLLIKGEPHAWSRLLSPFRYLLIKHDIKSRYDFWWPFVITTVTMSLLWILPVPPKVLGDTGFLKSVRDLIALFAAFFVVALAAVSTFARPSLDQLMDGTPPRLGRQDLTRREYVCFLFGYLSALSFLLFLSCVAAEIAAPSFRHWFRPDALWWIRAVLGVVFSFGFWNMAVTTFLGIWFLTERIHIGPPEDSEITSNRPYLPPDRPRSINRDAA